MFACLVLLAAATALFFSRVVARRIERIATAASRWSRGDLRERVDADSRDELGRLGATLNAMAAQLHDHVAMRARLASLEERQRLARDLHDTVKQKVFALNLQLATAAAVVREDGVEAERRLREAENLIGAIHAELAAVLQEMRDGDAAFALGPALRTLAEDWARRSGIRAEWERCDEAPLPRWIGEEAMKLAEEALANVWRHSGATRARLALVAQDGDYALTVDDDGCGIAEGPPGMGLDNMRARAGALPSGTLDIDTAAGRGTRVVARWREARVAA
jgi:signal transduction histidine kinase